MCSNILILHCLLGLQLFTGVVYEIVCCFLKKRSGSCVFCWWIYKLLRLLGFLSLLFIFLMCLDPFIVVPELADGLMH